MRPKCRKLKARKSTVYIDRARGRRLGGKSNRYARTQKSSNSLIRFKGPLLKLFFLIRNWHCWSRKAFPRQMTPQSREKTAKTAVFRHRWQAWKVVRSIAAVRQRPRTPWNWRCSFAFFGLSFDISIKNSVQRWSSDFRGLFRVNIRKMAQESNDLSTLPLNNCLCSLWRRKNQQLDLTKTKFYISQKPVSPSQTGFQAVKSRLFL